MPVRLPRGEVHCWYVDLAVPPEVEAGCYETLAEGERSRSARFLFDRDRRRFIVAHGVLRRLLGRYLGMHPGRLEFVDGESGKPGLRPGSGGRLRFNLSHSDDLAAVAVADADVGVDVERVRALPDQDEIARCIFPAAEVEMWNRLPDRLRVHAFFRCWTAREAHAKARGEGLATTPAAGPADAPPGRWSLHILHPPGDHVGTLVIHGSDRRLVERRWPADSPAGAPVPGVPSRSPW